jgi:uroporphyrinogen decarboxylase
MAKKFLQTVDGQVFASPPIWMMRQAGRYLPEYRELRATASSFLNFCYSPAKAAEVTLQPIRRFGFDAAILFSDILVIPDAMGQKVSFESGEGPRLDAISDAAGLARLTTVNMERLQPVLETIDRVKGALPAETTFLGFCGAPWTVASYMIAGRGTKDQEPARLFAYQHPDLFQSLIDRLVEASVTYLVAQLKAGVDGVQIFDSWSGVLPVCEFERWCLKPVKAIVDGVRAQVPSAKIIAFPRGAGPSHLIEVARMEGVSVVGLDTPVDPAWAAREVQPIKPVQGNLDPVALIAGGKALDEAVARIMSAFGDRPYIFNLGHGITPQTPIAHVEKLLKLVRAAG